MSLTTAGAVIAAGAAAPIEAPLPTRALLSGWRAELAQVACAVAYAIKPQRLPTLLPLAGLHAAQLVSRRRTRPDARRAIGWAGGLAGIADDLSPLTVLDAYSQGLYAFSHLGPPKWWAPRERMVLFLDEYRIGKQVRRLLKQGKLRVTFDTAFNDVMQGCAAPRKGRPPLTWIRPRIMAAFEALHRAGHAHSVEVWNERGELVGGLYGLAAGRIFFTESQFQIERDASKVALTVLSQHLQAWGFAMNDGKHWTGHLESLGFRLVPRATFEAILSRHAVDRATAPGRWRIDARLDCGKWEPAKAGGIRGGDLAPAVAVALQEQA